ncbi:putative cytokinetic ring protein SteA [Paenibacillus rigui]|uniref:Thiamine pyrophosphokinase n=1 Tax=Paenibacillus rigui TaxID=554312 RepID=A0A229UXJ2_9BACL|nr:putative cytokinetic ring protein SteA [Paenibacillus rigui]OXM88154.1 thiamine pyrophosphokinase [Paenibacillus rigui]
MMAIHKGMISAFPDPIPVLIYGEIGIHESTKQLLRQMPSGSIAIIWHDDLDELAAEGLLQANVRAVINAGQTMTGKVPATGCLLLLEAGVPVLEIEAVWFAVLKRQTELGITPNGLMVRDLEQMIPVTWITRQHWLQRYQEAHLNFPKQLHAFIDNTLAYAHKEKEWILQPLLCTHLKTQLKHKQVLIVVRGAEYKQELTALRDFIAKHDPVLIGVDGGADALLEFGYKPELIVGDMDSVSDNALQCGAELVVHAYLDGQAPGMSRVRQLDLPAWILPACGTSEDVAMLLAYDHGCERIVIVGAHSHMVDFLQKGRQGMGSTLLVRMKLGSKLIDAKGIVFLQSLKPADSSLEDSWDHDLSKARKQLPRIFCKLRAWFRDGWFKKGMSTRDDT